jgi:hypothetical protein
MSTCLSALGTVVPLGELFTTAAICGVDSTTASIAYFTFKVFLGHWNKLYISENRNNTLKYIFQMHNILSRIRNFHDSEFSYWGLVGYFTCSVVWWPWRRAPCSSETLVPTYHTTQKTTLDLIQNRSITYFCSNMDMCMYTRPPWNTENSYLLDWRCVCVYTYIYSIHLQSSKLYARD